MTSLKCAHCAKEFRVYPSRVKAGCKVCSLKCFHLLRTETTEQRFNRLVRRPGNPNDCWEWMGSLTTTGYGGLRNSEKKNNTTAHRVSYQIHIGPIPKGMFVCHTCDNPPCCNPAHLFLGTAADNSADMTSKGRQRFAASRGVEHYKTRLSEADVRAIRANTQASTSEIATQYGMSHGAIHAVRNRLSWRHLP